MDLATVELQLDNARKTITVTLPPGATITWPDLLRAAWDQHRDLLTERLLTRCYMDLDTPADPLLLLAVMARLSAGAPGDGPQEGDLQRWLADFWLF